MNGRDWKGTEKSKEEWNELVKEYPSVAGTPEQYWKQTSFDYDRDHGLFGMSVQAPGIFETSLTTKQGNVATERIVHHVFLSNEDATKLKEKLFNEKNNECSDELKALRTALQETGIKDDDFNLRKNIGELIFDDASSLDKPVTAGGGSDGPGDHDTDHDSGGGHGGDSDGPVSGGGSDGPVAGGGSDGPVSGGGSDGPVDPTPHDEPTHKLSKREEKIKATFERAREAGKAFESALSPDVKERRIKNIEAAKEVRKRIRSW